MKKAGLEYVEAFVRLGSCGFVKIPDSPEFPGRPAIPRFIDFFQILYGSRLLELLRICGSNGLLDILESCKF